MAIILVSLIITISTLYLIRCSIIEKERLKYMQSLLDDAEEKAEIQRESSL